MCFSNSDKTEGRIHCAIGFIIYFRTFLYIFLSFFLSLMTHSAASKNETSKYNKVFRKECFVDKFIVLKPWANVSRWQLFPPACVLKANYKWNVRKLAPSSRTKAVLYTFSEEETWAAAWQNQQNDVHPAKTQISLGVRPVWSEYSLCAQWIAKDPRFLHADSEVFAGHTCHFVGFVMLRLTCLFFKAFYRGYSVISC